jgi:hypothetical protein
MATLIYILCTLTPLTCAWLLIKSYWRTRHRLLFWSGLCFVGLTTNNLLVVMDRVIFPDTDLLEWRLGSTLVALLLLLFGLIWQEE